MHVAACDDAANTVCFVTLLACMAHAVVPCMQAHINAAQPISIMVIVVVTTISTLSSSLQATYVRGKSYPSKAACCEHPMS